MMIRVLFVCLGNICRSPMAEAVFQQMVDDAGLADQILVDSVGTGSWHIGEPAHSGTRQILRENGISYDGRARQVAPADMMAESYIVAMDSSNMRDLRRRFGEQTRLYLLLDFAEGSRVRDVPDPYFTGDFEEVFQLVTAGCRGLLSTIVEQEELQATNQAPSGSKQILVDQEEE